MQRYTSCGPDSFDIADDRFILMDADDHERHIQEEDIFIQTHSVHT